MHHRIIREFQSRLPCPWQPTHQQTEALQKVCRFAQARDWPLRTDYDAILAEAVNQKLALNADGFKHILDVAFSQNFKLNYTLKTRIRACLDAGSPADYLDFLRENGLDSDAMAAAFHPVSREVTLEILARLPQTDGQYSQIFEAVFSRFCYSLFPARLLRSFFSGTDVTQEDYFSFLQSQYPDICGRSAALGIVDVWEGLFREGYQAGCNQVLQAVGKAFDELNNHCDLAVYIPPLPSPEGDLQWRLYGDIILYAEKHRKEAIDKPYFRWKKIADQTCAYIPGIVPYHAEFEYAFQGFVFKDCFVLQEADKGYSLLLIFEKNVRDERIVHCPACFTAEIQGNSYPILNVRSWECLNPLCPDRSKYNRGKRYAFMSLFRQKETANDLNRIPETSIAKWRLDCVKDVSRQDALEMVIRHYSCLGDGILFFSRPGASEDLRLWGRTLREHPFQAPAQDLRSRFRDCTYFYRYLHSNHRAPAACSAWQHHQAAVLHGDSLDALRAMEEASVDGIVTSPPYYNAKSYSQWPNIYCYLYDMYNISRELYRVLKPGGVFLFNIFDYFDNENNIVLSAMGSKRMVLGAYMIDLFQRLGFQVRGNIIWHKGEIQGSRSFNQGNLTPYYQAPLNCWEHILILSKGTPHPKYEKLLSCVEEIRPVLKIVKGKNILGHEAPFPKELPELLLKHMAPGDTVLDPFLGSGTTCIAANEYGIRSIGVEKDDAYFALCQKRIRDALPDQLSLF